MIVYQWLLTYLEFVLVHFFFLNLIIGLNSLNFTSIFIILLYLFIINRLLGIIMFNRFVLFIYRRKYFI